MMLVLLLVLENKQQTSYIDIFLLQKDNRFPFVYGVYKQIYDIINIINTSKLLYCK